MHSSHFVGKRLRICWCTKQNYRCLDHDGGFPSQSLQYLLPITFKAFGKDMEEAFIAMYYVSNTHIDPKGEKLVL